MGLLALFICVALAWAISDILDGLLHLLTLLVPAPWLLAGGGLILVTWLMRD